MIISSDWHLDAVTCGVERFAEIAAQVDGLARRAIEAGEPFAFLGDLCDPDSASASRCIAYAVGVASRLKAAGVPSVWVAGNHDVVEDGRGHSVLEALASLGDPLVMVAEKPEQFVIEGLAVRALPYTARVGAYDAAAVVRALDVVERPLEPLAVLGHLMVPGALMREESHEMARGREQTWTGAECGDAWPRFNGHYHCQQQCGPIWIPGSLATLSFGEAPGVPRALRLSGGAVTSLALPVPPVEMVTVATAEEFDAVHERLRRVIGRAFVRVRGDEALLERVRSAPTCAGAKLDRVARAARKPEAQRAAQRMTPRMAVEQELQRRVDRGEVEPVVAGLLDRGGL